MPGGYNWLDPLIVLVLIFATIRGVRAGLIRSVFSILGLAAGLFTALVLYARASERLLALVNLPPFIADFISFIALFSLAALAVHLVGSIFALLTRVRLLRALDRAGGSASGLLIGLAVVGMILILLTAFPLFAGFQDHYEQSALAPPIAEQTRSAYNGAASFLKLDLPRLQLFPEDLGFGSRGIVSSGEAVHEHDIDFAALDGALCFVCRGAVRYEGVLPNDKGSFSPRFTCSDCGRTSDGCQTYKGYHEMYGQCPVILGNRGYRLDCGIWTNHSFHRPTGPCSVCGAN